MTTLPAIDLSYGTDLTYAYKRKRKNLGENYALRQVDGPVALAVKQRWQLVWENISKANKDTLVDFFNARYGVTLFEWTPYDQVTELKFVSEEPRARPSKGPLWTVTVNIEQVFDNG